ncbi:SET and MYND domain-containing protein 4 [Portunus trituberculatus]|uniref:Protein-lysine N-methyltransferase SMYD4 n=1 Tax=Portunus trituberculatus TaxID=210409 RepID=A0A5B7CV51_PORTR|nr:SET and MYND domain-containing protein 4 [Portunus trituberculatus]
MAAAYEEFLRRMQEGLMMRSGGMAQEEGEGVEQPSSPPPLIDHQQQDQQQQLQEHQQQQEQQQQHQQQPQQQLASSPTFKELYDHICQEIRSSGTLDAVMQEFQELRTDLQRVAYVAQLSQLRALRLEPNYSRKSEEEAISFEQVYDTLITNEASAGKALEVMKKCIQKTPPGNITALAVRYMKRGWASLLLEYFTAAEADAKISLSFDCPEELMWNSYEILGYCSARVHDYKAANTYFSRALENLRRGAVSNEVKATAAARIMAVFKTVKDKKNKKSSADKLDEAKKPFPPVPQLSYGPNKKFPSASSALSFVTMEGRGRCTVAKRDIKPGDVLMVDSPFCTMINPSFLKAHCFHCFAGVATPTPCSSCAKVWYCGEACREASWASVHQAECHVLDYLLDVNIGKLALLSFRVLTTVTWPGLQRMRQSIETLAEAETEVKDEPQKEVMEEEPQEGKPVEQHPFQWQGKYLPQDYRTVLHLTSNADKRSFGDMFKRSVTAVYLVHCLKISGFFGSQNVEEDDMSFVASILLRHLQGGSCNAYEISELEVSGEGLSGGALQEVGGALYTTISLTNHSCVANVARYSIGDKCVLRALVPIPRGSEVLDNYGFFFHSSTVNERQEVLLNQYKFKCECRACAELWPLYPHHTSEILIFRCPSPGCYSPCSYSTSSRTACNVCGNQQQYAKLMHEMEQQLKHYNDLLAQVRKGITANTLPQLLSHSTFMTRHVVPPVKHYTDLQEVIKRCYILQGNIYRPCQAAAPVEVQQRSAPRLRPSKREVVLPR